MRLRHAPRLLPALFPIAYNRSLAKPPLGGRVVSPAGMGRAGDRRGAGGVRSSGAGTGTITPPGPVTRSGQARSARHDEAAALPFPATTTWLWRIGPPLLFLLITILFVWP